MKRLILLAFITLFTLLLASCSTPSTVEAYKSKPAEEIFQGGKKALAKGNYPKAIGDFEALDTLYPFGPYAEQAQLDLIYAYYKNDDPISALAAADRYIRLYPRSDNVDYAYYMRGLINFSRADNWAERFFPINPSERELGYMEQAFNDFHLLLRRFPNSRYAPDARQRMIYIRNMLAEHEVKIAKFYYARNSYVAAANRASHAVLNYQGSPAIADALGVMTDSYLAIGENNLAAESYRLLVLNYPNSPVTRRLARKMPKVQVELEAPNLNVNTNANAVNQR